MVGNRAGSRDAVTPLGRPWARLLEAVYVGARGPLWVLFVPLRVYVTLWDRVLFRAWWWWGWRDEGIGHLGAYRRADAAFAAGYWWLYSRLVVIIQREIGD